MNAYLYASPTYLSLVFFFFFPRSNSLSLSLISRAREGAKKSKNSTEQQWKVCLRACTRG